MRSTGRQIYRAGEAAPFNPSPHWPEGYLEVLTELGVAPNARGFYAHWVRQFFRQEQQGRRRRDSGVAEIEHFLGLLTRDSRVQEWQVAQAREALEIYYEQFRGIPLDGVRPAAEPPRGPPDESPPVRRRAGRPVGQSDQIGELPTTERAAAAVPLPREVRAPTRVPRPQRSAGDRRVDWQALVQALRTQLRVKHYSLSTERTYISWVRRFVAYHHGRRPSTMGAPEIHAFLSHLAIERKVAASTQNQALNAIVFLYREIIKTEPGDFSDFARAQIPKRLPVVLSRTQVADLLSRMDGTEALLARLMYGTGMRVAEALRLRIQDVAFDRNEIMVRGGKGDKDRRVPLPASLRERLQAHLADRRRLYDRDRREKRHEVELPDALARKYPRAPYEWKWQYVFPAPSYSTDPRSGHVRRHHLDPQRIQRAMRRAATEAELTVRVTPHVMRHCFATHLLEAGQGIRTVQELLGHADVKTTQIYTHVLNQGHLGVVSPLDTL